VKEIETEGGDRWRERKGRGRKRSPDNKNLIYDVKYVANKLENLKIPELLVIYKITDWRL